MLVWHHLYISKPNFETHLACTIIAEVFFGAETFSSNIHAVFIHNNKTDLQNKEKHSDDPISKISAWISKKTYILSYTCRAPHYTYRKLNNRGIKVSTVKQEPHEHFRSEGGSCKLPVSPSSNYILQTIQANKKVNISLIELPKLFEFRTGKKSENKHRWWKQNDQPDYSKKNWTNCNFKNSRCSLNANLRIHCILNYRSHKLGRHAVLVNLC
jgi:hypothetical protein